MRQVLVVGMGVSNESYRLPIAQEAIERADTLIGARRHLQGLVDSGQKRICLEEGMEHCAAYIESHCGDEQIALLVSGDTGFYSALHYFKSKSPKVLFKVIPGVSSMQVLFARLGLMWHDAVIVSMHGRELDVAALAQCSPKLCLLTDRTHTPAMIAKTLVGAGIQSKRMFIGENLGYDDEKLVCLDLLEVCEYQSSKLNVVVICDEDISI